MYFVDENKNFTHRSEVDYPIDKVFPQFNNLQNFTSWNDYFVEKKEMNYNYFQPYEGINSAMKFSDKKNNESGELFIRYSDSAKSLHYELFEKENENPYLVDVQFFPEAGKTKMLWNIRTPKRDFLKRSLNLLSEDFFVNNIDKSMKNLYQLLSNKVNKAKKLASIKYDSLMIENHEGELLLGVNATVKNTKELLFKNIMMNRGKVINFVQNDLEKKDDEFGSPVLLVNPANLKDKEISYFYGVSLPKRVSVSDNNFSFRIENPSKVYVIYYQGDYNNRIKNIKLLLEKAKKDTMKNGWLMEEFINEPTDIQDVKLKLSLKVFR